MSVIWACPALIGNAFLQNDFLFRLSGSFRRYIQNLSLPALTFISEFWLKTKGDLHWSLCLFAPRWSCGLVAMIHWERFVFDSPASETENILKRFSMVRHRVIERFLLQKQKVLESRGEPSREVVFLQFFVLRGITKAWKFLRPSALIAACAGWMRVVKIVQPW